MYDLFSDLFDAFDMFSQSPAHTQEKKCPVCGRTYSEFNREGKLGCGECYRTFRTPVSGVLRQIHSTTRHTGKIPSKSGDRIKRQRQYQDLKTRLEEAVKSEDYELAAKLHKEIKSIEENR